MMATLLHLIDTFGKSLGNNHHFTVHLMFREVFDVNLAEVAGIAMNGQEVEIHTLNLHSLHQLTTEMQGCRRSYYASLIACKNCLISLTVGKRMVFIDWHINHVAAILDNRRDWSLAIAIKHLDEFVVSAVEKETEGSSS